MFVVALLANLVTEVPYLLFPVHRSLILAVSSFGTRSQTLSESLNRHVSNSHKLTCYSLPICLMSVACNHLILSLRGIYHDQSVSVLNQTLTSMVAAPNPSSGPDTIDTGTSDSRYYSQNFRISLVSNPQGPTSPKASKPSGDDAHVMSHDDIGMGTFSSSDKHRDLNSESKQEEGRLKGEEGEYIAGEAL